MIRKFAATLLAYAILAGVAFGQVPNAGSPMVPSAAPGTGGGGGGTPANPTATAGPAAVNGSASTYMRSDAAPPVQKGTSSQYGIVEVDGTTINSTAGVISAAHNGTVTSVGAGCGTSTGGSAITTTGNVTAAMPIRSVTGTTDTILSTDCGGRIVYNSASAVFVTLPVATTSGFGSGMFFDVVNEGAGTVTITPTTSTINLGSTLVLTTGQGAGVGSDGTNYSANLGKGGGATPGGSSGQLQTNNGSGGFGAVAAPSGAVVGTTDTQTLTNKSIDGSEINSGSFNFARFPAGQINHPGYKASVWYIPIGPIVFTPMGAAPALTTAYCSIGLIGGNSSATITALAARVTAAGSTNLQLAIYNDNASGSIHRPGTLIDSTPNIVNTSIAVVSGSLNSTHSIAPGFYWVCIQTGDITLRYLQNANAPTGAYNTQMVGSATLASALPATNFVTGVSTTTGITSFGTWPDFTSATFAEVTNTAPYWAFEFASVP